MPIDIVNGPAQIVAGIAAGLVIGVVASWLGVAGGELLLPTLLLLFGTDIKLAGSLSLAVSLPPMLIGFVRFSRDQSLLFLVAAVYSRSSWLPAQSLALLSAVSFLGSFRLIFYCRCLPSSC